uniref:CalN n=1 Tax=uncultured Candidatus Entotheonella sp. TaxID=312019 RepID=A0A068PCR9_9BACT|nr:CalN [uncultured Candidatus Entotheonella sp.]
MPTTAGIDDIFRRRESLTVSEPRLCWDVSTVGSNVAQALAKSHPAVLSICEAIKEKGLPHPVRRGSMKNDPFVRPSGHGRAFYIDLNTLGQDESTKNPEGCIAIKGSEAVATDFVPWMHRLRGHRMYWTFRAFHTLPLQLDTEINNLDRWPVLERKVPGVLTQAEATNESSIAFEYQKAHLKRYGEFAHLPIPLLVYAWPDEVCARVRSDLLPLLSKRGADIVEHTLESGIGIYVYFYPTVPTRLLAEVDKYEGPGLTLDKDLQYIERMSTIKSGGLDVQRIIEGWTKVLVQMMAVGYLPKDPGSLLTADCMQPWNVCVDGGWVDLDSVVPIESLLDEKEISDVVRRSVRALAINICYLMVGKAALSTGIRDRFVEIDWLVMNEVSRRILEEDRERGVDDRLRKVFATSGLYPGLDRLFSLAY